MTNYEYLVDAISAVTDDCIIWDRGKFGNGYGQVKIGGKNRPAHRVALQLTKPLPMGKVCSVKGNWVPGHKLQAAHGPCHEPLCFNPQHLSWSTPAENMADKARDGTDQDNENNASSTLSDADVALILSLYKGRQNRYNRTGPTLQELADQFDCSPTHACNIVNAKRRSAA
jgi:hypothetical protein